MALRRTLVRAGEAHAVEMPEDATLLQALRAKLGVTSASRGCRDGSCGACRVLVDGQLVASCRIMLRDVAEGSTIEAYEDLERDPAAARAVAAFEDERPTRCRLCVGGLAVTAVSLARAGRAQRGAAVDDALEDATCVCTGRGSLRRALMRK